MQKLYEQITAKLPTYDDMEQQTYPRNDSNISENVSSSSSATVTVSTHYPESPRDLQTLLADIRQFVEAET